MRRLSKNKTAQFYLLAAIMIIVLILGFAAVANYVKKRSAVKIYDVKEELNIESGNVLDFGTYKEDEVIMENLREHFMRIYTEYAGVDKEIYYIVGNENDVFKYSYEELIGGSISISIGATFPELTIREREQKREKLYPTPKNKILVTINDILYSFDLQPGENFYFVISQQIEGEQHVVSG